MELLYEGWKDEGTAKNTDKKRRQAGAIGIAGRGEARGACNRFVRLPLGRAAQKRRQAGRTPNASRDLLPFFIGQL
jgi:hypothetical protein